MGQELIILHCLLPPESQKSPIVQVLDTIVQYNENMVSVKTQL